MNHLSRLVPLFVFCVSSSSFVFCSDDESEAKNGLHGKEQETPATPRLGSHRPRRGSFSASSVRSDRSARQLLEHPEALPTGHVAIQEQGLFAVIYDRAQKTLQKTVYSYRTNLEYAIKNNLVQHYYPTQGELSVATTGALQEFKQQATSVQDQDSQFRGYLFRAAAIMKFARANRVTVVPQQREDLVAIVDAKLAEFQRLRRSLMGHEESEEAGSTGSGRGSFESPRGSLTLTQSQQAPIQGTQASTQTSSTSIQTTQSTPAVQMLTQATTTTQTSQQLAQALQQPTQAQQHSAQDQQLLAPGSPSISPALPQGAQSPIPTQKKQTKAKKSGKKKKDKEKAT